MNNNTLYKKISSLPDKKKKEVEAFIEAISNKPEKKTANRAKAGTGKGMFVMKPGFDEPLIDFKEYM